MGLQMVDGPEINPVTLEEAKTHLRITHDADDDMLRRYINSATRWVEDFTHRKLISQTWDLTLPRFPYGTRPIELPFGKIQSVTWIKYYDSGNSLVTLTGPSSGSPAGTDYQEDFTDDWCGVLAPPINTDWPDAHDERLAPVTVRFVAGYGTNADDIPDPLVTAVLYRMTDLYEFRGAIDGGNTHHAKRECSAYVIRKQ